MQGTEDTEDRTLHRSQPIGVTETRVHAVLLNWNSYEFTSACLHSLLRSDYRLERILVVDNGSADGSIEKLQEEFTDPHIAFLRNKRNEGFAGGMNRGFKDCLMHGADMIFSINNDTEVDSNCIGLLVEALLHDRKAGVAGPSIMYFNRPERIWQAGGHFRSWRAGVVVPLKGHSTDQLPNKAQYVTFLTGCAVVITREALEHVGMLDTNYFFYGEDLDYDLRVFEAGKRLIFVPGAKVWHKIDDVAIDRTSPYVLYNLARSSTLLLRKRFGIAYRLYGIALYYILYTPFRIRQIVKAKAGWPAVAAWFRGLADGVLGKRPRYLKPLSS